MKRRCLFISAALACVLACPDASAGFLAPGTYDAGLTGPGNLIWNDGGEAEAYVFNRDVRLESPGGACPLRVNGSLSIHVADGKTLSIISPDHYHPVTLSGRNPELRIRGGRLDIRYTVPDDNAGIYMDGAKLGIDNESVALTGGKYAFAIHDDSVVRLATGPLSVGGVYRGIAMQAHAGASTGPSMEVRAREVLVDAGTAGGAGAYLMAYDRAGTSTRLNVAADRAILLRGERYGAYLWGDNDVALAAADITLTGGKYGVYAGGYADGAGPADGMYRNSLTASASGALSVFATWADAVAGLYNRNGRVFLQGGDVTVAGNAGYGVYGLDAEAGGARGWSPLTRIIGLRSLSVGGLDAVCSSGAAVELAAPRLSVSAVRSGLCASGAGGRIAATGGEFESDTGHSGVLAVQGGEVALTLSGRARLVSGMEPVRVETGGMAGLEAGRIELASRTQDPAGAAVYAGDSGTASLSAAGVLGTGGCARKTAGASGFRRRTSARAGRRAR